MRKLKETKKPKATREQLDAEVFRRQVNQVVAAGRTKLGWGATRLETKVEDTQIKINELIKGTPTVEEIKEAFDTRQAFDYFIVSLDYKVLLMIRSSEVGTGILKNIDEVTKDKIVKQQAGHLITKILSCTSESFENYKENFIKDDSEIKTVYDSYVYSCTMRTKIREEVTTKMEALQHMLGIALRDNEEMLKDDSLVAAYFSILPENRDYDKESISYDMIRESISKLEGEVVNEISDELHIVQIGTLVLKENILTASDITQMSISLFLQYDITTKEFEISNAVEKSEEIMKDVIGNLDLSDVNTFGDILNSMGEDKNPMKETLDKITSYQDIATIGLTVQSIIDEMVKPRYLHNITKPYPKFNADSEENRKLRMMNMSTLLNAGIMSNCMYIVNEHMIKVDKAEEGKVSLSHTTKSLKMTMIVYLVFIKLLMTKDFINGVEIMYNGFGPMTYPQFDILKKKLEIMFENDETPNNKDTATTIIELMDKFKVQAEEVIHRELEKAKEEASKQVIPEEKTEMGCFPA